MFPQNKVNLEIQILLQNVSEYIKRNELDLAKELLIKGNSLSPNNPDILRYLSIISSLKFEYKEALNLIDQVINLVPNYSVAYLNRGNLLKDLGSYEEALTNFDKAIQLSPELYEAYNNKANTFQDIYLYEQAIALYDDAINLFPKYSEAYSNKANALEQLGKHEEALDNYQLAIQSNPQNADAYWNMALSLLSNADFERGWQNYEARWFTRNFQPQRHQDYPLIENLEDVKGKKILIWTEQGYGDTIQFCRYIKLLSERGAIITLEIPKALMRLLSPLEDYCTLVTSMNPEPKRFDFQSPLLSLPLLFKTNLQTIPREIPYLKSEPLKKLTFANKIQKDNKIKVGVVWSGGFREDCPWLWLANKRRNVELERIARLQDVPNIDFYSLQKGSPAESELTIKKDLLWPNINLLNNQLEDFSDTAALIDVLDLVISVDTSVVHLAGALGKPVWIINRYDSCWRWLRGQKESPWYPSARIYHQIKPGEWEDVINQVKEDLLSLTKSPRN